MFKKILGQHCSSARINNGTMILSLTNAIEPVVWMIDMSQETTLRLAVSQTPSNTYALQKVNLNNAALNENIAFYHKKGDAMNAMSMIGKTLGDQTSVTGGANHNRGFWCKLWNIFKVISAMLVILALIGYFTIVDRYVKEVNIVTYTDSEQDMPINDDAAMMNMMQMMGMQAPSQSSGSTTSNAVTAPTTDTEAVGVPMSADDFLQNRRNNTLPF